MKFGKKKLDEKKLMLWVNKALKGGSDMEQIRKVLEKKYPQKEVAAFLKKNYSIPEVKNKKLEKGLEEEKEREKEENELDAEMEALKEEVNEEEPEEAVTPEEVPEESKEGKEVQINDMSTYKIELLNQIASINQGMIKLIKILDKK